METYDEVTPVAPPPNGARRAAPEPSIRETLSTLPALAAIEEPHPDSRVPQTLSLVLPAHNEEGNIEWVVREAEWVYKAKLAGTTRLREIVPVWVGAHPKRKRPPSVNRDGINTLDLVDPTSSQLTQFVQTLFGHLRRPAR